MHAGIEIDTSYFMPLSQQGSTNSRAGARSTTLRLCCRCHLKTVFDMPSLPQHSCHCHQMLTINALELRNVVLRAPPVMRAIEGHSRMIAEGGGGLMASANSLATLLSRYSSG